MGTLKKALKWTLIIYVAGWLTQGLGVFLFDCSSNGASGYTCARGGEFGSSIANIDVLYLIATPILFWVFIVWAIIAAILKRRSSH